MGDFCVNEGFSKGKWVIFEEKTGDFCAKWGIFKEKWIIFAKKKDFQRVNE